MGTAGEEVELLMSAVSVSLGLRPGEARTVSHLLDV